MSYGDPAYTLIAGGSTVKSASTVGPIFGLYNGLSAVSKETVYLRISAEGANSFWIGSSGTLTNDTGFKIPGGASDVALPPMKAHELKDFGLVNDVAAANASVIWSIWRRYP